MLTTVTVVTTALMFQWYNSLKIKEEEKNEKEINVKQLPKCNKVKWFVSDSILLFYINARRYFFLQVWLLLAYWRHVGSLSWVWLPLHSMGCRQRGCCWGQWALVLWAEHELSCVWGEIESCTFKHWSDLVSFLLLSGEQWNKEESLLWFLWGVRQ